MKPRNVIVSLAIRTDARVGEIKDKVFWSSINWQFIADEFVLTEKPKVTIVQDTPKSKKGG